MSEPSISTKPTPGEPLYLYIAVYPAVVNGVLISKVKREQRPVFYISKTMTDAETRYPTIEKLALAVITLTHKLWPYFPSHFTIVMTTHPLLMILHNPCQSGWLVKWEIDLSEYDVEYWVRTCAKSQSLPGFIIKLAAENLDSPHYGSKWTLYVDRASSKQGSRIEVFLDLLFKHNLWQDLTPTNVIKNNKQKMQMWLTR